MNSEAKRCSASTKSEMVGDVKRQLLTKRLAAPCTQSLAGLQSSAVVAGWLFGQLVSRILMRRCESVRRIRHCHWSRQLFLWQRFLRTRRSRSLRARQISLPSSSYFAGSVSFIICRTSCPRRASESATGSRIGTPEESDRRLHLYLRRSAVTEITDGSACFWEC
jgi:hypothetical protein